MKKPNFLLCLATLLASGLVVKAQDITISTFDNARIVLANGSNANGFGLIGTFIELDNSTPTSITDIQTNYANLSWMSARFRPFGDGSPATGEVFSINSGEILGPNLLDNNYLSVTGAASPSPGSASSISYQGLLAFVWLFNGPIPTTQSAYDSLETGVFASTLSGEALPQLLSPSTSFTFFDPVLSPTITRVVSSNSGANFGLVAVPEPSTVALALLGAAGVLIARRRRK